MTDELKPCPFCGGEAACVEDGSHSTAWEIGCYNGQCAAEPSVWEPRKEVAITAWNTRADLATPMRCAECDCEKGGADCNWIATPAPAVKVKALVWEDHPACDGPVIARAVTLLGTYFIVDDTDDFSGLYLDLISHDDARWWQSVRSTATHIEEHWHGDVQPLKDKAQADYEDTILAALEPATPPEDPRVLALVEAATELEKQAKKAVNLGAITGPHWTHLSLARMKMAIALSALEENKLDEPLHRHTWNPPTNFGSKEQ